MPKKVKNLAEEVTITKGFPGKYEFKGGTSYYLDGDANKGEIHFSVSLNGNDDFEAFHISRSVDGSNVGMWFKKDKWDNNNAKNLPLHKKVVWDKWWEENASKVKEAGKEFWDLLNK